MTPKRRLVHVTQVTIGMLSCKFTVWYVTKNGRKFTVKNDVPNEVFYTPKFYVYDYTYSLLFRLKWPLKLKRRGFLVQV